MIYIFMFQYYVQASVGVWIGVGILSYIVHLVNTLQGREKKRFLSLICIHIVAMLLSALLVLFVIQFFINTAGDIYVSLDLMASM